MVKIAEMKATVTGYCKESRDKKDANVHASQLPNLTTQVAKVIELITTVMSTFSESCVKDDTKQTIAQLINFTSILEDVAEIKAIVTKNQAQIANKLNMIITVVQQQSKFVPATSTSSEPGILPSSF